MKLSPKRVVVVLALLEPLFFCLMIIVPAYVNNCIIVVYIKSPSSDCQQLIKLFFTCKIEVPLIPLGKCPVTVIFRRASPLIVMIVKRKIYFCIIIRLIADFRIHSPFYVIT